jgi:hypothetical protein
MHDVACSLPEFMTSPPLLDVYNCVLPWRASLRSQSIYRHHRMESRITSWCSPPGTKPTACDGERSSSIASLNVEAATTAPVVRICSDQLVSYKYLVRVLIVRDMRPVGDGGASNASDPVEALPNDLSKLSAATVGSLPAIHGNLEFVVIVFVAYPASLRVFAYMCTLPRRCTQYWAQLQPSVLKLPADCSFINVGALSRTAYRQQYSSQAQKLPHRSGPFDLFLSCSKTRPPGGLGDSNVGTVSPFHAS